MQDRFRELAARREIALKKDKRRSSALANLFRWEALIPYGLLLLAAQLLAWLLGMRRIRKYMGVMRSLKFGGYTDAVKVITAQNFKAAKLRDMQARLSVSERAVKALGSIASALSINADRGQYGDFHILRGIETN